MKSKNMLCGVGVAVVLQWGVLAGSAQADTYRYSGTSMFSGSERNITLTAGTYIITAYGASGGVAVDPNGGESGSGGLGAEMSAEFNFSSPTTLILLVGEAGGFSDNLGWNDGGGGGGSFVVEGNTPLVVAGGGGGAAFSASAGFMDGGNAAISTNGSAGGGTAGGSGGAGGNGGIGGDNGITGYVRPALSFGLGAGGGGGFYTDGGGGHPYYESSGFGFEAGGNGGSDNSG